MSTRRGILSTMTAGAALLAVKELASAKDNKPNGGFGATASVSVNSGNNSGNQTFQENQAILTMDANGNVQVQQGNASGGSVQQGAVASSSPAIQPVSGSSADCGCGNDIPAECAVLGISVGNSTPAYYVPFNCIRYYCQG